MQPQMQRLAELHIQEARLTALRLFSYSSTIVPDTFRKQLNDIIASDLANFSIHARRVNDLCSLKGNQFDSGTVRYLIDPAALPAPIEKNYHEALNRLIHATSYVVDYINWDGTQIFAGPNYAVGFVRIATDQKKAEANISIFGLSLCFLTQVIPAILAKYPAVSF